MPTPASLGPSMGIMTTPNPAGNTPRTARQSAEAFESLFIAQLMAPMFDGVDDESAFGDGAGQDIYRGMMIEQYGAAVAQRGGIGIADSLERYLLRLQETGQ